METENLVLREFGESDFPDFLALIRDKMSSPYAAYDAPYPTDEAGIRGIFPYFLHSEEFLAAELKAEKKVIGFIALNRIEPCVRNFGYCFHTAYQGKGYGTEAALAAIEYAKNTLKVQKLVSGTALANVPSVRLLKKAGFSICGQETSRFPGGEPFEGASFEKILSP